MNESMACDLKKLGDKEGMSYWRLDPSGRKPPKRITKRQWERGKNYVTHHRPMKSDAAK